MHEYVRGIYVCAQAACAKIHENAGRLPDDEVHAVQDRADVIAYSTMAEMQHFNQHRVHDYKHYMQQYLASQIDFYKQVRAAAKHYPAIALTCPSI